MAPASKPDLVINDLLTIPGQEINYSTSRSSGPGGQNVNKIESRVTLLFDVDASQALRAPDRQAIRKHLATRITNAGILRIVSQRHRTQAANRKATRERFAELLAAALRPRKKRRATATPRAVKRKRLENKKQRSKVKANRRKPGLD